MVSSRPIGHVFLLSCVLYAATLPASTVEVAGLPGIAGTDGSAGNPPADGGNGGPGGDGVAVAATLGDADNTAIATGGGGGRGGRGGDGEDIQNPEAAVAGGNGGAGGAGGNASATATTITDTGDGSATARAFGSSDAPGGRGGYGTGGAADGARGPRGANGSALASATAVAPGDIRISAFAAGGSTFQVEPGQIGISGGQASLGTVLGTSTNGGTVFVQGYVIGGSALGPGAAGADASLDNAIDGSTTGRLSLYQIAEAGATEDDDVRAGAARSALSRIGSFEALQVTTEAAGGQGFLAGDATSIAVAENATGMAYADARGFAIGTQTSRTDGQGGDGSAYAEARGAGTGEVIASADSGGGSHWDDSGTGYLGTGGDARSTAIATHAGTGTTNAYSMASGGRGAIAGGDADARAIVVAGSGGAYANVWARAGANDRPDPGGNANGFASLMVHGEQASAQGRARASGTGGSAGMEIDISGGAVTAGRLTVYAPVTSDGSASSDTKATAAAAMAQLRSQPSLPAWDLDYQAGAVAELLPGTTLMSAVMAANPESAAAVGVVSPGLLHAILGGGYAPDGSGGAFTYSSSIALAFDPAQVNAGDTLLLLLLDPEFTGKGFDELHFRVELEDAMVIDQTFTEASAALSFFDDSALNLGNWRESLQGSLDLKFIMNVTASRPGDVFYATFAATTVPLPPSAVLLGTALAAGLARRTLRRP